MYFPRSPPARSALRIAPPFRSLLALGRGIDWNMDGGAKTIPSRVSDGQPREPRAGGNPAWPAANAAASFAVAADPTSRTCHPDTCESLPLISRIWH
ncbi:hypothetical protein CPLU01_02237 [Colletotrichum plurivorum]|uniref:Uncharacterized protein n=1 Tax=Colletotrichum plurivorum TaxID=2175906 RepID=A0A8H6KVZ7_9PEZI|nr:hypothetical protein CPLU01_02237 [Colletotrichum plurivorum]